MGWEDSEAWVEQVEWEVWVEREASEALEALVEERVFQE